MAFSLKSATTARASVRAEAFNGERVLLSVASVAAATVLVAPSANAGVVLAQPQLKKAFQDDGPGFVRTENKIIPAPKVSAPKAAPSVKEAPGKAVSETIPEGPSIDPRAIALPGSLGFVAALAFAASKADEEFDSFMKATLIKDSGVKGDGVGYENVIKSTYGGIYGEPTKAGTQRRK